VRWIEARNAQVIRDETIFSTLINYVEFCARKTSGGKKCLVFPEILFF